MDEGRTVPGRPGCKRWTVLPARPQAPPLPTTPTITTPRTPDPLLSAGATDPITALAQPPAPSDASENSASASAETIDLSEKLPPELHEKIFEQLFGGEPLVEVTWWKHKLWASEKLWMVDEASSASTLTKALKEADVTAILRTSRLFHDGAIRVLHSQTVSFDLGHICAAHTSLALGHPTREALARSKPFRGMQIQTDVGKKRSSCVVACLVKLLISLTGDPERHAMRTLTVNQAMVNNLTHHANLLACVRRGYRVVFMAVGCFSFTTPRPGEESSTSSTSTASAKAAEPKLKVEFVWAPLRQAWSIMSSLHPALVTYPLNDNHPLALQLLDKQYPTMVKPISRRLNEYYERKENEESQEKWSEVAHDSTELEELTYAMLLAYQSE